MYRLYLYRDLIYTLVKRDLTVRYRRSLIGFLWSMLQPLLTMTVLHVVFSTLFAMELRGTGIRSYPVYVLSGILFYSFFQQSIVSSMNSLRANAGILQKLPVPMAVFPLSSVLSGLVNLFLSLVPLFGLLLMTGHPIRPQLLFLPVAILIAALFTLGAGLLLAPLSIFFTDVVEMVNVFLLLTFYLTPIIYPKSIVEKHPLYWVVRYNPIRSILEIFRDPIHLNKIPPLSHISVSLAIAVIALLIGSWAFHKTSDRIPFYI
jgi:ABC-type polysaccharide/polyol phosphate export permease